MTADARSPVTEARERLVEVLVDWANDNDTEIVAWSHVRAALDAFEAAVRHDMIAEVYRRFGKRYDGVFHHWLTEKLSSLSLGSGPAHQEPGQD